MSELLSRKQLKDVKNCKTIKCTDCSMAVLCEDIGDCIELAAKTAIAALDMLKRLEWVHVGVTEGLDEMMPVIICPSCDNWKEEGHKPDCELSKILKEVEQDEV